MAPLLDLRVEARRHMPKLPDPGPLGQAARATWRGRMQNEYASARVFEGLAWQMRALGLDARWAEACDRFAEEERMHGVLCGAVVEALGGQALAPALGEAPFPSHDDAAPLEALTRNLLSISCLSETVAVALIGAERLEMPEGELRTLLTRIWADEIGHARFGWRIVSELVAGFGPSTRARLGAYLATAFEHLEAHELSHLPLASAPPAAGAAFGLCSGKDARALFYDAVERVIVPGLEQAGLDATRAYELRHHARLAA